MRLEKTASGPKLVMSRSEWETIGRSQGWLVEAEAAHRPPKKWFDDMSKEVKEGNPDYDEEQVRATVGDIWYNELSDAKREEIYKRHGEKKSPNE
jgi:hypothetical protein